MTASNAITRALSLFLAALSSMAIADEIPVAVETGFVLRPSDVRAFCAMQFEASYPDGRYFAGEIGSMVGTIVFLPGADAVLKVSAFHAKAISLAERVPVRLGDAFLDAQGSLLSPKRQLPCPEDANALCADFVDAGSSVSRAIMLGDPVRIGVVPSGGGVDVVASFSSAMRGSGRLPGDVEAFKACLDAIAHASPEPRTSVGQPR